LVVNLLLYTPSICWYVRQSKFCTYWPRHDLDSSVSLANYGLVTA
jgi:hypothetical protein